MHVLNFGSYNYLGFADNKGPCAEAVEKAVHKYGNGICASRQELGQFLYDSIYRFSKKVDMKS